ALRARLRRDRDRPGDPARHLRRRHALRRALLPLGGSAEIGRDPRPRPPRRPRSIVVGEELASSPTCLLPIIAPITLDCVVPGRNVSAIIAKQDPSAPPPTR